MLRQAFSSMILMAILTGVIYPLAVTGIARTAFPSKADGSLIVEQNGNVCGSALIGQPFSDARYFWGRPSSTRPFPYNAASSVGSNQGPTNPELLKAVEARVTALKAADPGHRAPVPVDLVTASASGLDPHISRAAALYQVPRVARARGLSESAVRDLVLSMVQDRLFGVLGEPVVPVLELNLALEAIR